MFIKGERYKYNGKCSTYLWNGFQYGDILVYTGKSCTCADKTVYEFKYTSPGHGIKIGFLFENQISDLNILTRKVTLR
jgi:hypothetical protein